MTASKRLLLSLLAMSVALAGQAQTLLLPKADVPLPEFAAATIKPASVNYIGVYVKPGGRVIAGNCPVLYLVTDAFHVPSSRVTGGPDWAKSTKFDIDAVPPDDSPARQYNPPGVNSPRTTEQSLMLQALLRDRFGFRYHIEKMEQPVFFLRLSGKSLKLNPPKDPKGFQFMGVNAYAGGEGNGEIEGTNATMTFTALRLSERLGRTVIDQTGLTGAYDFHVEAPDAKDADIRDAAFEGLKKLGLELKAGKAPVDTVVIDAVSQPTPN